MQLWLAEKIGEKVNLTSSSLQSEATAFSLPGFIKE
jgi:hypothetical protein